MKLKLLNGVEIEIKLENEEEELSDIDVYLLMKDIWDRI